MAPPLCPRVPRRRPSSSCSPEKNTPKQYRRRSVKKGWRAEPSRREAEATGEATTYSGSSGTVGPDTVTFQTSRVGRADARTNGAEGREGSPLTTSWQTPGSRGHHHPRPLPRLNSSVPLWRAGEANVAPHVGRGGRTRPRRGWATWAGSDGATGGEGDCPSYGAASTCWQLLQWRRPAS